MFFFPFIWTQCDFPTLKTHSIKARSNHLIRFIHHFARGSKAVSSLALDFLSIPFNIDFLLRTVFLCSWKNTLWAGSADRDSQEEAAVVTGRITASPLRHISDRLCYCLIYKAHQQAFKTSHSDHGLHMFSLQMLWMNNASRSGFAYWAHGFQTAGEAKTTTFLLMTNKKTNVWWKSTWK